MSKWVGIGLLIAGIVLVIPLIIAAFALAIGGGGGIADCEPGDSATVTDTGGGSGDIGPIPGKFVPFYQGASDRFGLGEDGPSMLAGIHFHETSFSTNVATSGGYQGPMAIIVSDWDHWGVDGNGDGKKDIMDEADAIYAAAKILKSFGAPKDWRNVLASYNAGPANKSAGYGYADDVMKHAEKHHVPATGGGGPTVEGVECAPSAGGGTVSGNVQELAQQILDLIEQGKVVQLYKSGTGDTIAQLKRAANGQKFQMTCTTHGGPKDVDINPDILKAVIDGSKVAKVDISNITDKCHFSASSNHYTGKAIDLGCATTNINALEKVFAKYGGANNGETCPAGNQHWHYDFL